MALYGPSPLCDAVSLPPVPRFCERPVFHHAALPCVAPFPPAALPAFTGTTAPSDSLNLICHPPFIIGCPAYSHPCKGFQGLPGYHVFTVSGMPCSQTPGKLHRLATLLRLHVDFRQPNSVILPVYTIFRGSIASAFLLTACCLAVLRLTALDYPLGSKDLLPGGWQDLPGRDSHPLKHATLPGRTRIFCVRQPDRHDFNLLKSFSRHKIKKPIYCILNTHPESRICPPLQHSHRL